MDRIRYRLLVPLPQKFERLGQTWELRVEHYQEYWALQAHENNERIGYCAVRYDSSTRLDRALYVDGEEVHSRSIFAWMFQTLAAQRRAEITERKEAPDFRATERVPVFPTVSGEPVPAVHSAWEPGVRTPPSSSGSTSQSFSL